MPRTIPVGQAAEAFFAHSRVAVVGVSRGGGSPANAIADKLRDNGHTVFLVNPHVEIIGRHPCYPTVDAVPGGVEAVVAVTPAAASADVARQAAHAGATWIWFHQGFGPVSYDPAGVEAARDAGLNVLAMGCPMMYLDPDVFHACARTVFKWTGRIPRSVELADV
ncbi:MAG: CoA-binding protein [Myxococcota bacterium]